MKVHVWIILLFFSSIAYAEEDIRWKDADEKMQEQQYELSLIHISEPTRPY